MKLTKPQKRVLTRVSDDGGLMRGRGGFWFLDGTTANARVVKNLIAKNALIANGDSMFGTESQTYSAT